MRIGIPSRRFVEEYILHNGLTGQDAGRNLPADGTCCMVTRILSHIPVVQQDVRRVSFGSSFAFPEINRCTCLLRFCCLSHEDQGPRKTIRGRRRSGFKGLVIREGWPDAA